LSDINNDKMNITGIIAKKILT